MGASPGPKRPVPPGRRPPAGDPRPVRPEPKRLDGGTWFALMVLGGILFAAGVYFGAVLAGWAPHGAYPTSGAGLYLPYAFTILGGALATYSYEEWYQSPEHREKRGGRQKLADLPSYEHYVPPRERAP